MKKLICLIIALILALSLVSCKGSENSDSVSEDNSAEAVTSTDSGVLTTNSQGFFHFTHNFSDSFVIDRNKSTDVCLCATYKGDIDFVLSASLYNDEGGTGKARSIANSVKKRETSSYDIAEKEFGGITFYSVCFDSYEHSGKRLCNMFAQTEPAADGSYFFIEIYIDNMPGDSTLTAIDKELSTLKFSF
ncbi:MAG: hypothetical protein IJB86_11040 [Clostridia bacterium]|nr:hypothetical protein [Clostridia bacterium]